VYSVKVYALGKKELFKDLTSSTKTTHSMGPVDDEGLRPKSFLSHSLHREFRTHHQGDGNRAWPISIALRRLLTGSFLGKGFKICQRR
jgi:hypothetical protein